MNLTEKKISPSLEELTKKLKETVKKEGAPFVQRNILAAESFRQTQGEPFRILRVAHATAYIFDKMPVLIRDGELLVGWHPNTHPDENMQNSIRKSVEYLITENYWVSASEGHMSPDYETILKTGLEGIKKNIQKIMSTLNPVDPETPGKIAFYESAGISIDALQNFIQRYATLAKKMADETTDEIWRNQLLDISNVCFSITKEPPHNFQEALQLVWFIFLSVAIENGISHICFGPGRMDQYLYPYYLSDKQSNSFDKKKFEMLVDQFFIKCNEFDKSPTMSAVIMAVGGRKPDGTDATNELSYEFLKVSDRVQMYFPGVDVLWHKDIDDKFMTASVNLLKNGKGQPSFFNSDVIVKGLLRYGIPFSHAVDHIPSTCTETSIMGRSNPWVAWPYINVPMCFLYALFGGKHPITKTQDHPRTDLPHTWQELKKEFFKHLEYEIQQGIANGIKNQLLESWYRPFPLLSCFIQDCIGKGKDISHGGALYNFLQPEAVGVSNVVDGLVAVKTLVEEQKKYTLNDFRKAICADFDGYEDLHGAILRDCPKYGNDTDWINKLFAEVTGGWCSCIEGHKNFYGGPVFPGFLGWTVWIDFGKKTPATPDGRKAGSPLANSLAPCTGVTVKGIPAMMLSASEFDHSRGLGGMTFNIRFTPSVLKTDNGVDKLKGLIEACFDIGIYQTQINLVSSEVLKDAQKHPGEYTDLFIRIGGYLVPFILLPEDAQNEVIARTELDV